MKRLLSISFSLLLGLTLTAQSIPDPMSVHEKDLKKKLDALRAAKDDSEKELANLKLIAAVEKVVIRKEAFDYPFDSLKTMGTITSPDGAFRLFNWNVEQDNGSQKFYCYVVKVSRSKYRNNLIKLNDQSENMRSQPTDMTLDQNKWFGALYYKIIPVKKGPRTLYTLLAWDGNSRLSTKKFVEVLYFQGNKKAKFGYPVFKNGKEVQKRYFLEFSDGQYVSMKHHATRKEQYIVHDHLSPKAPQLEGLYEHYVTDGSYDALKFEEGFWTLKKDVDQKNPGMTSNYHDPVKKNYDHKGKEFKKIVITPQK